MPESKQKPKSKQVTVTVAEGQTLTHRRKVYKAGDGVEMDEPRAKRLRNQGTIN